MSVTGIGGFFLRCADPTGLRDWYAEHLGLEFAEGGGAWFAWRELGTREPGRTVFGPFAESTDYFDPGTKPFMVNYRVRDLDALLDRLRAEGESVAEEVFESEDGRFGWVVDPDGQKVELWAPADPVGSGTATEPGTAAGPGALGLGGIFFKSSDPAALKKWYGSRLGILPGEDGYVGFRAEDLEGGEIFTAWEVFPADTTYFDSEGVASPHPYMVNFRVGDLDLLLDGLRSSGVWVDPETQAYEYGKFGWARDPMGLRIELWEPPADPLG